MLVFDAIIIVSLFHCVKKNKLTSMVFWYYLGYNYERLDGSVRGEERFLAVNNFNDSDDTFIFLLSTKAGIYLFYQCIHESSFCFRANE